MGLYRLLTDLGAPLITRLLKKRLAAGREDPDRFPERLGGASLARPRGKLIWCHAASVGEAMSVLALIRALRERCPKASVLVTTGTVTSARMLEGRLPEGAFHQFVPVDRWPYVQSFLTHWQPDLAIWVESELWPNMLEALRRKEVPVILVNGRMSKKSFRRWSLVKPMVRRLLAPFKLCLLQTEEEKSRYDALGAKSTHAVGNLKFAAAPLDCDLATLDSLQEKIGDRPVWVMASTHPGEEEIAAEAHKTLLAPFPDLLTILCPRHPARGDEIRTLLEKALPNVPLAQRSKGEEITPQTGVYLADTLGEMGLFYRLAPITGLAGSFKWGGHNPIEPAQLGSAVIFGPRMENFRLMAEEMLAAHAAIQVPDTDVFTKTLARLLSTPEERKTLAQAALTFAEEKQNVLAEILSFLEPYLSSLS